MKIFIEKDNGFTLMELMIVIFIISILATGTGFAIINKMPDYHLQQAANVLFLDLQLAKSKAVMYQEVVRIDFSEEKQTYSVTRLGNDNLQGGEGPAADTVIKLVNLSEYKSGVVYGHGIANEYPNASPDNISFNDANVQFHINGSVGSAGYVYLTHRNRDLCYRVGTASLAGAIRIDRAVNGVWEVR